MSEYRIERDSMGELKVPARALYGAQTQRAVDNFPISGLPMPREFIRALGLIKSAAAQANADLGHLKKNAARAIRKGEELTYDYGIVLEEPHTARIKKIWQCLCGSPRCTGTILKPKRKPKARKATRKKTAGKAAKKRRAA